MANELNVSGRMTILKRSADGRLRLLDFAMPFNVRGDVSGQKGPLPGSILVPLTGVDVDLAQLTAPGVCFLHHQGLASGADPGDDPTQYYVDIGIRDVVTDLVYPLLELVPGDQFVVRLSRNLEESYNATGTGTGPPVNWLHLQAHGAACTVWIGAFER